jgi:protein-S-isoprenylcysteine O-methyltransferase Ste14
MMRDPAIRPATLIPPPLVYAVALAAAWRLDRELPLAFDLGASARPLGWFLIGLGLAGFAWALTAIWNRHTTVNPYKAASNLVTSGPFRHSRNPIYVSDWFVYVGVMLLLRSVWPLLLAPVVFLVMRYLVVAHEERHLEARFGDEYRAYKARVRRWF